MTEKKTGPGAGDAGARGNNWRSATPIAATERRPPPAPDDADRRAQYFLAYGASALGKSRGRGPHLRNPRAKRGPRR